MAEIKKSWFLQWILRPNSSEGLWLLQKRKKKKMKFPYFIFNCYSCNMITDIVWTDDRKLLQESNLTARQPRRVPIMLYNSFNKCLLANRGLVNLTGGGYETRTLGSQHQVPDVIHYSMAHLKWLTDDAIDRTIKVITSDNIEKMQYSLKNTHSAI